MQYFRCKCGQVEAWTSGMPIQRCRPCKKCGTVPGSGPNNHPDPLPHDFSFKENVQTDGGHGTLTRCSICLRTKAQIEKEDQQEAAEAKAQNN